MIETAPGSEIVSPFSNSEAVSRSCSCPPSCPSSLHVLPVQASGNHPEMRDHAQPHRSDRPARIDNARLDDTPPARYSPDMSTRRTNQRLRSAAGAIVIAMAACVPASPIQWKDVRPLRGEIGDGSILAFDADSGVALVRDTIPL